MDNQNPTQDTSLLNTQNPAVTQAPPQAQEAPTTSPSPALQTENPNTFPPSGEPNKSDGKHTLIAVLLLLFVYPIGLIYMWIAASWPRWVKIVLSLPILLAIVGIALTVLVAVRSPGKPPVSTSIPSITTTNVPETNTVAADSTANWKTFVSNSNDFSIDAPSTWTVRNDMPQIGGVECLYFDDGKSLILSACYRQNEKLSDSLFDKVPERSSVKKMEINGFTAYRDKQLLLDDYYILNTNGTFILITPGAKLDSNLFEKVVLTFQFK